MRRLSLLSLAVPLSLVGCTKTEVIITEIAYPDMLLSQSSVEFGTAQWGETVERTVTLTQNGISKDGLGMTMGVQSVEIVQGTGTSFSVSYDLAEMVCPERAATEDTAATTTATAKEVDVDTGSTDTGTTGTDTANTGTTTPDGTVPEGLLFTMEYGCSIPLHIRYSPNEVGDIWAGLVVSTAAATLPEDAEEDALPEYQKDPEHSRQVVFLHGQADHASGTLVVRPRTYDFGYVNADDPEEHYAYIELQNVGDGDVTINSVALSDSCDAAFRLDTAPASGTVISPDQTGLVAVEFDPDDTNGSYCELFITSDDAANPEVDVILLGNSGDDASNSAPTAAIRAPDNGYRYSTIRDLTLEVNIFDVDQPAPTLGCKIKSAVLQVANLVTCEAPDDSGHFWVTIPREDLDDGVDTLVLTVTDANGQTTNASVSVLIDTDYPADDDDGDGYGPASDPADCDDANGMSYPYAAEVFDGADNDCDGIVDEGTEGYDDDGDGLSEIDGDCNDFNETALPGAPERGDGVDNDCDGLVDEGTTLYDDDGDGYAEVNGDCDDGDPLVNPAATEVCDGVDNDCDTLVDRADGCVETDSDPEIVGEIRATDANACLEGETVTVEVKAIDQDGDPLTYLWSSDAGDDATRFDNPTSPVTHWVCPELDENSGGKAFSLNANVFDDDGGSDYGFVKIAVYPSDFEELHEPFEKVEYVESEGCSTSGSTPSALLVVGGALAASLIRRRRS